MSNEENLVRQGRIRLGELEAETKVDPQKLVGDQDMDAQKWAKAFNQTLVELGYQPHDEGWLIGWFANPIMVGYDCGAKSTSTIAMADPCSWHIYRINELLAERARLDNQLALAERTMRLMVAQCGLPDHGDALLAVIETYRNYKKGIQ